MWSKSLETLNPYEGVHKVAPDDLLPCPFCGGEAKVVRAIKPYVYRVSWTVACENRCCTIPDFETRAKRNTAGKLEFYDGEVQAANYWNRRADND